MAERDDMLALPVRIPPSPNGGSPAHAHPHPGVRGYQDPAEVAGRPVGEIAYWAALALAAGADVAAFHQVVSLVMRSEGDWLVWLMVLGFTACALTLTHFGGRIGRDVTAKRDPATWAQVAFCLGPWLALGLIAFAVRLISADVNGTVVDGTTVGSGGGSGQRLAQALMFLALYTASGVVTFFGAYLTRNPLRVGYRRALRAHNRTLRRMARSQPPYERAVHVYLQHVASRRREADNWRAARDHRLAQADELKRLAAALIAAHLQSPPATDGMTLPDRRPLTLPPDVGGPDVAGPDAGGPDVAGPDVAGGQPETGPSQPGGD